MKANYINGWNREKVMAQLKKYNNGTRAMKPSSSSLGDHTVCSYKDENDNRCFIGAFIPDNHSALTKEADVFSLLSKYPDLERKMPIDLLSLGGFQQVHDNYGNIYYGPAKLSLHEVAENWLKNNVEDV